jgi:hypothetical protein
MNMRDMGCALSVHQKECQKSLGCALYIGARYLPENTVLLSSVLTVWLFRPPRMLAFFPVAYRAGVGGLGGSLPSLV